jgi:predicted ATPase/class 3 adenylate cyclase
MAELPTGTVTFLFTDIEGSTARWEQQPEAMRVALARHDALVRAAIQDHGGYVVKTTGDGFHAVFARAPDALVATLDGQCRLQAEPWGEVGALRVRMALHTGAAEERDGDYYGPALNRAARLLASGRGGQILLTEVVAGLVREALPDGVRLLDLGRHRLRDLTEPMRVFQVVAPDLVSDFPPLASLDARRQNLPTHPTALLGRERELVDVRQLLEGGARLVTLTGPGGTGKTRLGLQVAADLLGDFEHGAFLVELAPISDPTLVPSTIAQALGVRDVGSRPIVDALSEHLRGQSLLLLLDNFEQVLPAASVVAVLLADCPGLAVLATSREPLRLRGEHEYAVMPLALPDAHRATTAEVASHAPAVALFSQRARAIRADFALTDDNAPAVAEICARLDGLPLAIELAAARIKLLPPLALLNRLERRLQVLTGGARDAPARQRTLRDTMTWSHNLLDDVEQRLFRRLAVFVGGCTLEATEAVCLADDGGAGFDALDVLASLVDKSLLRQVEGLDGEPRFTMLETIREYGLEQLVASGESEAMHRRHAAFFLARAERAEPHLHGREQLDWLAQLEVEHDNLRAALAWSQSTPDGAEMGLRLAGALWWFWYLRGHFAEGWRQIEAGLATTADAPSRARITALVAAAHLSGCLGEFERLAALAERGLALATAAGDEWGTASSLGFLGEHARLQGDYQEATRLHEQSLDWFRRIGDRRGVYFELFRLAEVARNHGEYDRATALHEESLAMRREAGDKRGISASLLNLGEIAYRRANYSTAESLFDESLALRRELDDRPGIAWSLNSMGKVARARGQLERASVFLAAGLALQQRLGDKGGIATSLELLGRVAHDHGDLKEAARLYAESMELLVAMRNREGIFERLDGLIEMMRAHGRPGRIARLFGAVEAGLDTTGAPFSPAERAPYEVLLAASRAELGAAFVMEWNRGRETTLEEAIAYALAA